MIEKLNEGDVIYTSCTNYTLCYHLGIVYFDGKKKMVYHNDPSNKNRYGGTICAESYDRFMKGRIFQKVVRTNAKNSENKKQNKKQWPALRQQSSHAGQASKQATYPISKQPRCVYSPSKASETRC